MLNPLLRRSYAQFRSGRSLVIYDLETSGLPKPNLPLPRAWQIAAQKVTVDPKTGTISEVVSHEKILNIGEPLPVDTAAWLKVDPNKPLLEGYDPILVLARFSKFIEGSILVGANIIDFDNPILANEFKLGGLPVPPQLTEPGWCIDTTLVARNLFPPGTSPCPTNPANGKPSNRLNHLGQWYQCEFNEADLHRALADVRLCGQVLVGEMRDIERQMLAQAA